MCFSLEELLEAFNSRGKRFSVRKSYSRMLAEMLREKKLKFFAKCIREWVLVQKSHVYVGGISLMFVNSRFTSGGSYLTLNRYDQA